MEVRRSWRRRLPLPRGERVGVRGFGRCKSFCESQTPSSCPSPPSARLRASSTRYGGEGTQRAGPRKKTLAMNVCRSWHSELPLPRGERVGVRGFGRCKSFCESRTPSSCPSPPSAHLRASSTRYGGEGTQRVGATKKDACHECLQKLAQRTPSPQRGEGWGEGVRTFGAKTRSPNPLILPSPSARLRASSTRSGEKGRSWTARDLIRTARSALCGVSSALRDRPLHGPSAGCIIGQIQWPRRDSPAPPGSDIPCTTSSFAAAPSSTAPARRLSRATWRSPAAALPRSAASSAPASARSTPRA